jgi:hypothetical protein
MVDELTQLREKCDQLQSALEQHCEVEHLRRHAATWQSLYSSLADEKNRARDAARLLYSSVVHLVDGEGNFDESKMRLAYSSAIRLGVEHHWLRNGCADEDCDD